MLRPEEVEQLVCGCPTLDLNELRKVTVYDGGFKKDDQTIVDFWQVCKVYYLGENLIFCLFNEMKVHMMKINDKFMQYLFRYSRITALICRKSFYYSLPAVIGFLLVEWER